MLAPANFLESFCRACRRGLNSAIYRLESENPEETARARLALLQWQWRLRQIEALFSAPSTQAPRRLPLAGLLEAVQWVGSLASPPLPLRLTPSAWPAVEISGAPGALGSALLALCAHWQRLGAAEVHASLETGRRSPQGPVVWLELLPRGIPARDILPRPREAERLRQAGALHLGLAPSSGALCIQLRQLYRLRIPQPRPLPESRQPLRLLVLSADVALAEWLCDRLGRRRCFCLPARSWHEGRLLLGARDFGLVVYDWNWPSSLPGAVFHWLVRHRPQLLSRLLVLTDPQPSPDFLQRLDRYRVCSAATPLSADALAAAWSKIYPQPAEITRAYAKKIAPADLSDESQI